jgi:N-acetylglucosamine malate deacetylase 2
MARGRLPPTIRSPFGLLDLFCASRWRAPKLRVVIVVAHPDDEVIGAGARLHALGRAASLVHVTDGAPRNPADAVRAGARTRLAYAAMRRDELARALQLAGCGDMPRDQLHVVDQEASFQLSEVSRRLAVLLERRGADIVVTHPYEGGHPDHDAAAFAVQTACALLSGTGQRAPARIELTSYHAGVGGMRTGEFLAASARVSRCIELSSEEQRLKRNMLDAFVSQREVLRPFGTRRESFAVAPVYDFNRAPHVGTLHYEQFDWGITGVEWRRAAARALEELASR